MTLEIQIILGMSGTVAKFSTSIQQLESTVFFFPSDKQTVFIDPVEEAEDIKFLEE